MAENCASLREDITEIKEDIKEIKNDLAQHMSRTAASEARLEVMEDLVKGQLERNNEIIDKVFAQSTANQEALNKQLKLSLGIFAAIATLITAIGAWLNAGAPTP